MKPNKELYNFVERIDVLNSNTVLMTTSRPSIRRDLEYLRNNGYDMDIDPLGDKTQARISFKNSRQMAVFASKLKVHKLWNLRAIDFVHAVRRGIEA